MSFSVAWDETSPDGNQDASLGDDRIREFKTQMRERLSVDLHFPSTDDANTGYHEKSTYIKQNSDPLQVANALILYSKTVGSYRELFSCHENAAVQQLTRNGKLWLSALGIASQAQGDLPFFDGSIFNRLAAGVSGQFLKTFGAGANPAWGSVDLKTQSGFFTRDISTPSGTQGVTGVSFTPDVIILMSCVDGSPAVSIGFAVRASGGNLCVYNSHLSSANNWGVNTGQGMLFQQAGGAAYVGQVSSFDVDGFTVTWAKSGAPAGTGTIGYLAFAFSK